MKKRTHIVKYEPLVLMVAKVYELNRFEYHG
jgi:hypothetical protein